MIKTSPTLAPKYSLYRTAIDAVDVMSTKTIRDGCNAGMYENTHIQVLPAAGVNPDVEIWFWSPNGDKYVKPSPVIARTGLGDGIAYEFSFKAQGRIFFVQVAATTGDVDIAVAGFDQEQTS